ncbi:MAG: glycosyltransferase family 1 protein, partial [bacterium]|nr:glycosyltransferase family 1 protein [bacterium]
YVPDEDMPYLYAGAELFVFPSLYEGFGLPPLEAMACGCPVITSNVSSLPEVVGDAGIMVAPDDTDGLAEAMARVLGDKDLMRQMSLRGLEQAGQFSWERTARQMLDIFRSVAG